MLLVDFEDSFVHNLADRLAALGSETHVVSARDEVAPAWNRPPTHLVLSPGPGAPEDFPLWRDHLDRAERAGLPVLGVCLGHQALAQHLGARIGRHHDTVHGRASPIHRTPEGRRDPLLGAWSGSQGARYHSLAAFDAPATIEPLATLTDGTLMAMRARDRPWWGLQFHPESLLTESGDDLLRAFLEVRAHV